MRGSTAMGVAPSGDGRPAKRPELLPYEGPAA